MDAFSEFLKNINDALLSLYNQKFRQQETVLPTYLTTLNCNVITSVFRTVSSENVGQVIPANLIQPNLTIEFSAPGPPLIINYNREMSINNVKNEEIFYVISINSEL